MPIALASDLLRHPPAGVAVPAYDRAAVGIGIAHFGVGNFHRVHEAVYVDRALHRPGNEEWGIVGIGISDGPAARAKAALFAEQDCLYSVTEFSPDGTTTQRVIGSIVRYLHAPQDPEAVLEQLSDPALRIVSMTITEGGYLLDEASGRFLVEHPDVVRDLTEPLPRGVFGYLVRALARRRAAGIAPFTVISCDNLRRNGDTAKRAVVAFAAELDPELASWIESTVAFPNSMVDRIAPYVSSVDRDRLDAASGLDDAIPAMSESYLQWVIEDCFPSGRPALEQVGVELRNDVALFETVKGRMLNASHVLLAYAALLLGHRYVHDALADPQIRGLIETYMTLDAIPLLQGPVGVSLEEYRDLIVDRFANPAVGDQLIRIATDGSAKIPVFHSATIRELLDRGADVRREAFLLACYRRYLGGVDDLGGTIDVTEPTLSEEDRLEIDAPDGLGLLRIGAFASLRLADFPDFAATFLTVSRMLETSGTAAAIDMVLAPAGAHT